MGIFNFLFSPNRNSAAVAKERLKIVLAHERASNSAPDFLPKLQKELIDVVARYVSISDQMIRVNVGKSGETSVLEINIELEDAKPATFIPPRRAIGTKRPAAQPAKPG
ncbi:MAG: cell division topological specificity factor MinE [Alphaproteobacteria bacterium]|nr:cell division topological specificity factor MinE [Alphaproteobacteria bacterium]